LTFSAKKKNINLKLTVKVSLKLLDFSSGLLLFYGPKILTGQRVVGKLSYAGCPIFVLQGTYDCSFLI